jgi:hypothetical protein
MSDATISTQHRVLESTTTDKPEAQQADLLSIETLHRTYTGLLDDVLLRYSDEYIGAAFFNKMIAKNIFFGGGLYLNDGYLVNHPIARRQLLDDYSLLRVMIQNNFVRILTRASSGEALARMPERMAKDGNKAFADLIASPEWPAFEPKFKDVAASIFYSNNARPWPKYDMSISYCKLTDSVFASDPKALGLTLINDDQFKRVRDRFLESRPAEGNPRHKFEMAAKGVITGPNPVVREAMRQWMDIGNQAYHYNFGLTLTAEDKNGVAVDTTIGPTFDELLESRSVHQDQIDSIPLLRIPNDVTFDDGDVFRPFMDPASNISKAKLAFLDALRKLLASNPTRLADLKRDVHEATKQYLDRIEALFKRKYGAAFEGGIYLAKGRGGGGQDMPGGAATSVGLAITLVDQATAQSRQFLVERFRLKDDTETFSDENDAVFLRDIRPQLASLRFNRQKARDFILDVPPIKV